VATLFDAADATPWDVWRAHGVRVGTASWTDKSLIDSGKFYPPDAKKADERLAFYAENFPVVEVDSTYYGLPSEKNAELWVERTPDDFVFNVKAFSLLTQHPTTAKGLPKDLRESITEDKRHYYPRDLPPEVVDESWARFLDALRPLHQASKLGAILFQFPEWFPPSRENRRYVVEVGDRLERTLPGVAAAIEFRNDRWMGDEERRARTLAMLEEHGLPYVCVDMPQGFKTSSPPIAAATAPLAMVRFHGRRNDTWGKRGVSVHDKFGYDYRQDELAEWEPKIEKLSNDAREVHVLMNNCYQDYAVRSARTMAQLLLDV
jgi:uncharacterized protein YecE (DUF72 family)